MASKSSELLETLQQYEGKKLLIALQGHPDPDCISSAMAQKVIAAKQGVASTIAYARDISHQENRALSKLLGIETIKYPDSTLAFEDFAGYCVVDSQLPDEAFREALKDLPLVSRVDHHDIIDTSIPSQFEDIDKTVGATATTYAKYLEELGLLSEDSEEDANLATALAHGIRSDTDNLINAKHSDYGAIAYLSNFADHNLLRKISVQALSPRSMDIIQDAYSNKTIEDNYLLSGVGVVRRSDRDAIPQAADFLLRRAGIDTVLVYGIVGNSIDASLRTTNDGIRPSDFIKETFPEVKEGDYGGRYDKGGFQLPLGIFGSLVRGDEDRQTLTNVVDAYMQRGFYEKLGIRRRAKEGDDEH